MTKPIPAKEQYPELYNIAKKIARETAIKINAEAKVVVSEMPYKAQMILEFVVEILEAKI
jgi:vacuolar-type H+-ATPase subunit H